MAIASFIPSVTGLSAQAQALGTVSTNIANMRTIGYRPVETMFQTLLGHTPATGNTRVGLSSTRVGINGVTAYDRTLINQRGDVSFTGGNFDVALNTANAFFMVENPAGDVYYTRAGNFTTRTENGVTYLIANNGFNVDGFAAAGNGFAAAPSNIVIDPPIISPSVPTSTISLKANVPSESDSASFAFQVYGANNDGNLVSLVLQKEENTNNVWHASFAMPNGTVDFEPVDLVFNTNGQLVTPKELTFTVTADNGDVNTVTMDIAELTQYASDQVIYDQSQNGRPSSKLSKTYIDGYGILKAEYDDGNTINLAKLAVVGFTSPEALIQENGTMFAVSNDTGPSFYVIGPDTVNSSVVSAQSVESSPVSLEQEFSNLIVVQRAYSLNTTSFTTTNEMLQTTVNILS